MEFRTVVPIRPFPDQIDHRQTLLMMGSCFAENIGNWLVSRKFSVDLNPFGILYNPHSVADAIYTLLSRKEFSAEDLFLQGNLWHSFSHHSRFSHTDPNEALRQINERVMTASENLKSSQWLIITWGTAFVYELADTGRIVSNCHKLPEKKFKRRRVSVQEITQEWSQLLETLQQVNPGLKILFTVSPIRHLKDGAHDNQLSKSILLLAIDELCRAYPDTCTYFPSYEIMMDELRDYRFYAADMVHPSEVAINYIREKFSESFFSSETRAILLEWDKLQKAIHHRPLTPDSIAYKNFGMQNLFKLKFFQEKYPFFDVRKEMVFLQQQQESII